MVMSADGRPTHPHFLLPIVRLESSPTLPWSRAQTRRSRPRSCRRHRHHRRVSLTRTLADPTPPPSPGLAARRYTGPIPHSRTIGPVSLTRTLADPTPPPSPRLAHADTGRSHTATIARSRCTPVHWSDPTLAHHRPGLAHADTGRSHTATIAGLAHTATLADPTPPPLPVWLTPPRFSLRAAIRLAHGAAGIGGGTGAATVVSAGCRASGLGVDASMLGQGVERVSHALVEAALLPARTVQVHSDAAAPPPTRTACAPWPPPPGPTLREDAPSRHRRPRCSTAA